MEENIIDIIQWWEHEINHDTRRELMAEYQWNGTREERHEKLREFREKWLEHTGGELKE